MHNSFKKGLLVGGLIGASMSMVIGNDRMRSGNRRRMIRTGRNIFRKSGNIVNDVVDLFR
jgi:hypothetical protein